MNDIIIGNKCSIGENCVLHASPEHMAKESGSPLILGDNVVIESGALLQGCTIQSHANVQLGSVVLDSAIIGTCSVVTAGSLVPEEKRIPARQLWGGNPVEYIRDLSDDEVENLKKLSEEKLSLSKKHETEHMKTAADLLDDAEEYDFYYQKEDKGKF
jgi:carbonic anhydrase/acetyltransferase-like protein (isoleucine patch superfamily)